MSVILVGTGCGSPDNMTIEVRTALMDADLIIGARRLVEGFGPEFTARRQPAIYAKEICEMIRKELAEPAGSAPDGPKICVAFSGDSGFYSGTRSLLPLLKREGIRAEVLPGISSIQVFSARLQEPWQDWRLVSAHGTDCDAVTEVMQGSSVFFLTGGELTPAELCGQLTEAGLGALEVIVGERLTYEDEKILQGTAEELEQQKFAPLSVMLARPAQTLGDLTPGIPDEAFIRGEVPMTKETVRAAILSRLEIRGGDVVWDVGAGTGSVSVEMAMRTAFGGPAAREARSKTTDLSGGSDAGPTDLKGSVSGRVYAVEREPEGCALIRKNRERFGTWNLRVIEGSAPEALASLPAPDKVFIGGSSGNLSGIIETALEKNPGVRICISAIVLETLQEAIACLAQEGMEAEVIQVAVNASRTIGRPGSRRHMMMAGNPIFIVAGQRRRCEGGDHV